MTTGNNLKKVLSLLPIGIKLIAVSKTKNAETIMEAYQAGQRLFGENKVQELVSKWETLPKDIEWHFIGHLQSNKVRLIAPFVTMIHAIDSVKILKTVDDEAKRIGRVIPCLIQVHIATEETKFGFSPDETIGLFQNTEVTDLKNVTIAGVMGMATYTDDEDLISKEFSALKILFHKIKEDYFKEDPKFCEISMGMSQDYHLAIENGSTMVRVGSSIFGER
ncbi:MAG: YggS family pyridoxal phosphate-dependent enzyme [Mariniphaga sp.]